MSNLTREQWAEQVREFAYAAEGRGRDIDPAEIIGAKAPRNLRIALGKIMASVGWYITSVPGKNGRKVRVYALGKTMRAPIVYPQIGGV